MSFACSRMPRMAINVPEQGYILLSTTGTLAREALPRPLKHCNTVIGGVCSLVECAQLGLHLRYCTSNRLPKVLLVWRQDLHTKWRQDLQVASGSQCFFLACF